MRTHPPWDRKKKKHPPTHLSHAARFPTPVVVLGGGSPRRPTGVAPGLCTNKRRAQMCTGRIECLWIKIRKRLYREDPGRQETRPQWVARVARTVRGTSAAVYDELTASMHRRVKECVEKGGGRVRN